MSDIVLKGDELEYWKAHSDLIDALSEWAEDDTLEIKLEWFPKFTEDDFNFLKKSINLISAFERDLLKSFSSSFI